MMQTAKNWERFQLQTSSRSSSHANATRIKVSTDFSSEILKDNNIYSTDTPCLGVSVNASQHLATISKIFHQQMVKMFDKTNQQIKRLENLLI